MARISTTFTISHQMSKPPKFIYRLNTVFKFGKHKDHNIQHVIQDDPQYLYWCMDNVEGFELHNEAMQLLPPQEEDERYLDVDGSSILDWTDFQ